MIVIDPASPAPPYEQVRTQLAHQIRTGELTAGARLPTVRRLADDLGLAVNTVARAYRELEAQGLVGTLGRNGTIVRWSPDHAQTELEQTAQLFATRARALGITTHDAQLLIEHALRTT